MERHEEMSGDTSSTPTISALDPGERTSRRVIEACRKDPNPFIEYMLCFDQAAIHENIQDWYTLHNDCYVEQHRGIGKTVQTAARVAWEIGHHPEDRWKYVQGSVDEAKESVDAIRRIVELPRYRHVFPNATPDPTLWGKHAFRFVVQGTVQRDPTVEACGIFDNPGGRADGFVFDDICTLKNAIQQPALRGQVKEAYANTHLPMIDRSRSRPPRVWRIGTCWHVDDITADWRRQCGADGTLLRTPVVNFRSPWPAVYTPRVLMSLKGVLADRTENDPTPMGVIAYGRAYELVPISSEQLVFDRSWIDAALYESVPPDVRDAPHGAIGAFDLAYTEESQKNDPDWSVFAVGYHHKGHLYVEDLARARTQFPVFVERAAALGKTYGVRRATGEGNGPQRGIIQTLNSPRTGLPFPVVALERTQDKITRASAVQAFVQAGRLHLRARRDGGVLRVVPALEPMYDELVSFPAGEHDDTVDAVIDLIEHAARNTGGGFKPRPLHTWNNGEPMKQFAWRG